MDKAGKVLQKIKSLKDKVQGFNEIKDMWEDLTTLVQLGMEEDDESVLDEVKSGYENLSDSIDI